MLTEGGSFIAVTPIVVQDGVCQSHLYPPSSKRYLAKAIISGCALFIVCLLGWEPSVLSQASRPGTAKQGSRGGWKASTGMRARSSPLESDPERQELLLQVSL